jgi:hypothetical protein
MAGLSKQKLLYQRAWLKAMADEGGLKLVFQTKAGAYEARKHLYEAVRGAKKSPMEFPELAKAAEGIQIVWAGDTSLWMRHRDQNDATQGLEAALGTNAEQLADEEAEESLRKLGELMGDTPKLGGHQDNPFHGKRS